MAKKIIPKKSKDIPVTQEMLFEVRDELKFSISSLEKKMDSRFSDLDSKFSNLDSKFDKMMSEIHRIGLIVEEQRAQNIFTLDGYTSSSDRLDQHEEEIKKINKTLSSF